MADVDKTVFLSYRRDVSWALAQAVRGELVPHGFDVFVDTQNIDGGEFERVILRQIEARTHFVVLLEPRSLDRIGEEGDWMRRELAHALRCQRNVVPLLANAARMPRAADLPIDVERLPAFNAVSVPHDYFIEAMQKLRDRFLRVPMPRVADPAPASRISEAARRPDIPKGRGPAGLTVPTLTTIPDRGFPTLTWTTVEDAILYDLHQAETPDFARSTPVTQTGLREYVVDSVTWSRGRWFRVRAIRGGKPFHSPWSAAVEAMPSPFFASVYREERAQTYAPSLTAQPLPEGTRLTWTRIDGAEAYELRRSAKNPLLAETIYEGAETTYLDAFPMVFGAYFYRVRAMLDIGEAGGWSAQVRVDPAP